MAGLLQQGIAAAKAGRKSDAQRLLVEAANSPADAESAWLWLSGVVEQDAQRLFCLDNALRINPNNEPARHGADVLRMRGIFPAPLDPPRNILDEELEKIQVFTTPESVNTVATASNAGTISRAKEQTSPRKKGGAVPVAPGGRQELSALYRMAATDLSRKVSPTMVVKNLTSHGLSQDIARKIVVETQRGLKRTRGEKFRRRMIRGLLWTLAGGAVTCGTYFFANNLGGTYLLCWGAIILGVIDFFAGLVGWLANR